MKSLLDKQNIKYTWLILRRACLREDEVQRDNAVQPHREQQLWNTDGS